MNLDGTTVLFAHPSGELYGSDRVLIESVAGVVRAGGRAVVTLPVNGPLEQALANVGAEVELCQSPVLRKSALRPRGFVRLVASLPSSIRAGRALIRRVRPDAIYVNTVTVPLWVALGRLSRVPVLSHLHEAEESASRLVATGLNFPLTLSTRIIANSQYSVDVLGRTYPGLARRSRVVYNGVLGPDEPRMARQTLDGGLRVLYIGRLSDRKGVDVAVAAIGLLAARGVDASLDIVGAVFAGYEWYEDQLRRQIADLGIEDRVHLRGFTDNIWSNVDQADVVVVPSRFNEPFGNTAVEALLAARPVIVSDTSGLREAAGGYESARAVTPGNPEALADSLEEVIRWWQSVREDAYHDRIRAAERHSPDTYQLTIARIMHDIRKNHYGSARLLESTP